jgi:hypothetical protein
MKRRRFESCMHTDVCCDCNQASNLGEECNVIHRKLKFERMNLDSYVVENVLESKHTITIWLKIFSLLISPFWGFKTSCGKQCKMKFIEKNLQHLVVLFLLILICL